MHEYQTFIIMVIEVINVGYITLLLCLTEESLMTQFREEAFKMILPLKDSLIPPSMANEIFFFVLSYYAPIDAKSEQCRNDSSLYVESALKNDLWALQMFDASSKLEAGILDGYLQPMGNYDACINIVSPGNFTGQHCIMELLPTALTAMNTSLIEDEGFLPNILPSIFVALCVPSSCSYEDVKTHATVALAHMNLTIRVNSWSCSTRHPVPWDIKSILSIFTVSIFIGLVLLATFYDFMVYNNNKKVKNTTLLSCFSLHKNLPKLSTPTSGSTKELPTINGLRVIAILWIVTGHRYVRNLSVPSFNLSTTENYTGKLWIKAIFHNSVLGVEIFLLITGLLVTYIFLKKAKKQKSFSIIQMYIYRYMRITPSFAVMMLVDGYLLYHLGDGPVWKRLVGAHQEVCDQRWWTNLLYITNYYYPATLRGCLPQAWYLNTDLQLFLFSPLLLLPLHNKPVLGLVLIFGCLVATVTALFIKATIYELKAGFNPNRETVRATKLQYTVTHLRAASYFMGMALGYFVYKFKQGHLKVKLSRSAVLLGWLLCLSLMLSTIYSITFFTSTNSISQLVHSLHMTFYRPLFALAVVWVVFVGVVNPQGIASTILSLPIFTPLSTLSYGIYLTHVTIQTYDMSTARVPVRLTFYDTITKSISDIIVSMIAAIVLFVTVEAPFIEIIKMIFLKEDTGNKKDGSEDHSQMPVDLYRKTKL